MGSGEMTNEEIFELAETYGEWDDFGRWTFRDNDGLLRFVDAVNMSQERVDETAKSEHEFECPRCGHCCQQREWFGQPDLARVGEVGVWGDKREWVGLDGEIPGLGLVTEEFYNGMLCAEDILRKRNT
jgi:hypothetical protein